MEILRKAKSSGSYGERTLSDGGLCTTTAALALKAASAVTEQAPGRTPIQFSATDRPP